MTVPVFVNDTPGPVEGGCDREGCGHASEDHYRTTRTLAFPGVPFNEQRGETTGPFRPCNVRGYWTHCVCYEYVSPKVLTPA